MKKILKWFTLVEILIVIVIIGILIWALVPRMQSAQWRARDVARKNDLSQLQAAIVTSYQDKWERPWLPGAEGWVDVETIRNEILAAWMNGVPQDPLSEVSFDWVWSDDTAWEWQYRYIVIKSYWSPNWAFALMAKTEVEWWSNWVVCDTVYSTVTCPNANLGEIACGASGCNWIPGGNDNNKCEPPSWEQWKITSDSDVSTLKPCSSLTKDSAMGDSCVMSYGWVCKYSNESQLRYVLLN